MYSLKLKITITTLMMLAAFAGYGQLNSKITGTVKDSITRQVIGFATVVLSDAQTHAPVRGTQTDINGNFALDNAPAGTFVLHVSYVGYGDIIRDNITTNAATENLNLGDLLMIASKNNSLKEVVVTRKKDALQNIDGKKVFAVNQSLVSKGGTAADLLQNVPTLQIDPNGNVSLRGSTGVKVLVDGKPSVIANGDITQILQSLPASSIESIEVIPNPPAKYDANGEGIINIILKKNSRPGFNGSAEISGGTRDNYNSVASLSYQSGKVNLYGNYSIKDGNTYSNGYQYMTFLDPAATVVYSNETFPSLTRNKIQFLKAGIDCALTPLSTLGISGNVNLRNTHRDEVLSVDNYDANNNPVQLSNRNNTTSNNGKSYEFDVDYSQHFKKPKEELTFNFSYTYGSFKNYQEYQSHINNVDGQKVSLPDTPLISDIRNKATNYNMQADYVLPVGKRGQFSAGYRSQITLGNNDQFAYNVLNSGQTALYPFTSFFSSNNKVQAVYVNFSDQIANFSYQIGVRGEEGQLDATFVSYDVNNQLFASPVMVPTKGLYPSVLLKQKLEDNSQLQFTYAHRISRPTARELNSATDFSDPVNYETGNPGLKPESINNFELGFNKTWQNITFTSSIYYSAITNVIKHIQLVPDDGITITTAENLRRSTTAGLELIAHFDLLKGWDLTANANIYERDNDAAPQFGIAKNTALSWNANVTTNITPVQRLSFQIHTDYRGPDMILQDRYRTIFGLDAAAKYDISRNASLSFNANNVFNTRTPGFLRNSDDLSLAWERRVLSSRATLTFAYRFGTGSLVQHKKKEVIRDKRVDDGA